MAQAHIASTYEAYPRADGAEHVARATRTHRQGRFEIATRKLPISKAEPIDAMERELGIPVPEMIFGENAVAVRHAPTGWAIEFTARDALAAVDKTGRDMLRVAYASEWSASREQTSAGIRDVVKPYDWSYSTTYRGTVHLGRPGPPPPAPSTPPQDEHENNGSGGRENGENQTSAPLFLIPPPPPPPPAATPVTAPAARQFAPTTRGIPIELLKRRDPILFFDEVMLYESELDDNGISILSAKVRVHERRMLLLCRLFMRLDGVVVRVRDTRIYVDFETEEVIREYTVKELAFEEVKRKLLMTGLTPDGVTIALRDANRIAELVPTIEQTLESVSLKS
ncbi:TIP41-domain-containing protein [Durotheca rogersii]|uniref:TIP41-domain-containing protein n=1 Tax=Durotheca rogersii TaxID=419775 RepID=UPI00221F5CEF|nr:TIP41-domain-containing protein [Durotheca rogersii]KAI5859403.1 TIP41-domain-containing protein [Durotheca rogersii]